jgi:hypothetical protein
MAGTTGPLAPGDFTGLSGKVTVKLMLRLVLTALYVSLKLVPQHRFYLSEFCVAKLSLLIHFLKVSQQVASGLSVSNGLIAQLSHHHECHGDEQGQDQEPERQLPGSCREKLQHASTRVHKSSVATLSPVLCTLRRGGPVLSCELSFQLSLTR